ncbi:MAG: hypothetical protein ACREV7_16630 [Steroidobacteraceae bacterium]
MAAGSEFNVAVLVTLRSRIRQGLQAIGRDFGATEARVVALQRSLDNLQMRHGTYAARARTVQAIERQGVTSMQQRLTLMQATNTAEQAATAESLRMRRIEAEQLTGLQRRRALQQITTSEAAAARRFQLTQQVEIETKQKLSNALAMQNVRTTETENRLLLQRRKIQERNLELSAAQAEARGATGLLAAGGLGGPLAMGALAVGYTGYRLAKAGLPIGLYLQQIQAAGSLSRKQMAGIPDLAMRLSGATGGQEGYKQALRALSPLVGLYGLKRAQQMAPLFRFAGLESTYGEGNDLATMTLGAAQAMQTMRATTPARQAAMLSAMTTMLVRTGGTYTPAQFERQLSTITAATPKMAFTQRLQTAEMMGMLHAKLGPQRGLTSAGEAGLFSALLQPAAGRDIALVTMLEKYGLSKTIAGRTPTNVLEAIAHAPRGLTLPQRMMAGGHLATLQALQNALRGGALERLQAALAVSVSPQRALAMSLTTAQPVMTKLATALDNFAAITGAKLAKALTKPAGAAAHAVSSTTNYLRHHTALQTDLHVAGAMVKDSPLVLLAEAIIDAAKKGIAATPPGVTPSGQPINIFLDGKKIAEVVTGHQVSSLKHSAMAGAGAGTPIASPHVIAPSVPR